jgi:transposase-like protein
MNSASLFCPNIECPARGQVGKGNIGVHSQAKKRYICHVCEQTFSASRGTLFYRLRTDPKTVLLVIALLVYGCPVQAIVQAFGLDERTVRNWWERAGVHCQAFHERLVEQNQLDLGQLQADEIKAKTQKGVIWIAMAMMVSTRLWLGGAVSAYRDTALLQKMAEQVRAIALCRPLLIAVDGLNIYLTIFREAFRTGIPRLPGQIGRMTLVEWPNIAIVQVIKSKSAGNWNIQRVITQGAQSMIKQLLQTTQGGGMINTAYIERLNATFRQRLACLFRRTRHLARQSETLQGSMFVLGCVYNFCDFHKSLRLRLSVGRHGFRWVQRTPALAAGLADHRWTLEELFTIKTPPRPWIKKQGRGRLLNSLKKRSYRYGFLSTI